MMFLRKEKKLLDSNEKLFEHKSLYLEAAIAENYLSRSKWMQEFKVL
jgi:hypothetical protein